MGASRRDANPVGFPLRLSPAAVRLVANQKNYFPIGHVETASLLWRNRPDDSIFVKFTGSEATVDFAFLIPANDLVVSGSSTVN